MDSVDLLGEFVIDSNTGMPAEVEAYDSSAGMYRIRYEDTRHTVWRPASSLTLVGVGTAPDPQELAIQAENEDEIELLVRKGYAGLIAAALLGDEEATRKVRALICQIGD